MRHDDIITAPTLRPHEAVRLGRLRTAADIRIVEDIYEAYEELNRDMRYKDPNWYTFCLLATCWNAGRIEGMRKERARRKGHSKTKKQILYQSRCLI